MIVAIDARKLQRQLVVCLKRAPPRLISAEQGLGTGANNVLIGRIIPATTLDRALHPRDDVTFECSRFRQGNSLIVSGVHQL